MNRIGRIRGTVEVPARADLPAGSLDRLRQAFAKPLHEALDQGLRSLAAVDPDAVWVLRSVRANVNVPATASVDALAARLAAAVVAAVAAALRSGAGTSIVRFVDRADHLAAFVAALAAGAADSWIFDGFAGLRPLAPLPALRTGVAATGGSLTAVLAALSRRERLDAVVVAATPAEAVRTWSACRAEHPGPPVGLEQAVRRLAAVGDPRPVRVAGEPAEAFALRLLGAAGRTDPLDAATVGAVEALAFGPGPARSAAVPYVRRGGRLRVAAREATPVPPDRAAAGHPTPAGQGAGVVFAARGAPVFLALPSFAAVGAGEPGVDPRVRRAVLAAAFGVAPEDPAVGLAAGPDDPGVGLVAGAPLVPVLVRALIGDHRLDPAAVVVQQGPQWTVARVADDDTWLAVRTGSEALVDLLTPVLGVRPAVAPGPAGDPEPDLAWLLGDREPDPDALDRAVMARAGLRHLARRLLGFERSSVAYLNDRFLTPGGVVSDDGNALLVELTSPPLQVVLTMAGLDAFAYRVPWLDRDIVVTHGTG